MALPASITLPPPMLMTKSHCSLLASATPFSTVEISGSPATRRRSSPRCRRTKDLASSFSRPLQGCGTRDDQGVASAVFHVLAEAADGVGAKNDARGGGEFKFHAHGLARREETWLNFT